MKKVRVQAGDGRTVTFPSSIPNLAARQLRGAMPAIPKHGIEATPADAAIDVDLTGMREDAAARAAHFIRRRIACGDLVTVDTPNAAAARPAPRTTTARRGEKE